MKMNILFYIVKTDNQMDKQLKNALKLPLRKSTLFYPYFFHILLSILSLHKNYFIFTLLYCYHIYNSYIKHIRTLF